MLKGYEEEFVAFELAIQKANKDDNYALAMKLNDMKRKLHKSILLGKQSEFTIPGESLIEKVEYLLNSENNRGKIERSIKK